MKRKLLVLTAALVAACAVGQGTAQAHRLSGHPSTLKGKLALAKTQVKHDKISGDNHWLRLDKAYVVKLSRWIERASRPVIGPSWLVNAFMCIHRGEGSWTDYGDPYWGGLQMDRGFMMTYGSWAVRRYGGWANVWPPSVQIAVAITAYKSGRGFYPWPNTARACGLI